jgi:hypothetical protein
LVFSSCYVQSSDPAVKDTWKDKGTGQLSIKCKEGISKGAKESKPTIVVRNDVCSIMDLFWFLKSLLTLIMVLLIDWFPLLFQFLLFAHLGILFSFDRFCIVLSSTSDYYFKDFYKLFFGLTVCSVLLMAGGKSVTKCFALSRNQDSSVDLS